MKKFEPNSFLAAVQKYKITVLPLVPPIIVFLCKSPLVAKYDFSSVREIFSGAAPLGKEQAEEVTSKLGVKCLRQGRFVVQMEGQWVNRTGTSEVGAIYKAQKNAVFMKNSCFRTYASSLLKRHIVRI